MLDTTTTVDDGGGNPGYYLFDNLAPGTYSVQFVASAGYVLTAQDAGIKGANNSDADPDTGQTAQVTLASGDAVTYVDAGLVVAASIEYVADLSVSQVDCVTSVGAGYDTVYSYTLTVTNHGPNLAKNVESA